MLDRGAEPQKSLPTSRDGAAGHGLGDAGPQDLRDVEPARQVELSLLEVCQTRTQVEPDRFGERHREMREAMRVDGDALEPRDLALAQGALDRGAGLPAVEDDRLIIKDAPLVEDMSIGANGIGSPPRVEPCRPEIACRLQAHHVGRGKQPASP